MHRKLITILSISGLVLLAACGNPAGDNDKGGSVEPVTVSISGAETTEPGGAVELSAVISGDGAEASAITWAAAEGTLSATSGDATTWTAPEVPGSYTITATITAGGQTESDSHEVAVTGPSLTITADEKAGYGETIQLSAAVSGGSAASSDILWTATAGQLSADSGSSVSWTAPAQVDSVDVWVRVRGQAALNATHTIQVVFPCDTGDPSQPADPCGISTPEQLQLLDSYRDGHFILTGNIDASGTSAWNEGAGFEPIGRQDAGFSGTLDGAGFEISDLAIDRPESDWVGLFGVLMEDAVVVDLSLTDVDIKGSAISAVRHYAGAVAGELRGTLSGISVSGMVVSHSITGGLAGLNSAGLIEDSVNESLVVGQISTGGITGISEQGAVIRRSDNSGSVDGRSDVGGVAGQLLDSQVSNAENTGKVTGLQSNIGGLIGYNGQESTISNSHSSGPVQGGSRTGGLAGLNHGAIEHSSSTALVTATGANSGGLVGSNGDRDYGGTISHSYAAGNVINRASVTTSNNGGLAGTNYGTISDSYSASSVESEDSNTGGLVGYNQVDAVIERSYSASDASALGTYSVGGLVGINHGTVRQSYSLARRAHASASRAGGLVGYNQATSSSSGSIEETYSITAVTAHENPGGLVGVNAPGAVVARSFWDQGSSGQNSSAGEPDAIAVGARNAMFQADTFTSQGWDFDDVWQINPGVSTPDLRSNQRY